MTTERKRRGSARLTARRRLGRRRRRRLLIRPTAGPPPHPSCRLHYAFNPATGRHEDRWCPIRDVGTAGDLAVLQRRLGSTAEFEPVIAATLQHYCGMLVRHAEGGAEPWCHLPAGRQGLGEPSSVAHSSMLLLALAAWGAHPDATQRRRLMAELAAGILRQQRPGGAFRIYFEPQGLPDSGWQLYGGEAAFALATACGPLADSRLVRAACVALRAYQAMHRWAGAPQLQPVPQGGTRPRH